MARGRKGHRKHQGKEIKQEESRAVHEPLTKKNLGAVLGVVISLLVAALIVGIVFVIRNNEGGASPVTSASPQTPAIIEPNQPTNPVTNYRTNAPTPRPVTRPMTHPATHDPSFCFPRCLNGGYCNINNKCVCTADWGASDCSIPFGTYIGAFVWPVPINVANESSQNFPNQGIFSATTNGWNSAKVSYCQETVSFINGERSVPGTGVPWLASTDEPVTMYSPFGSSQFASHPIKYLDADYFAGPYDWLTIPQIAANGGAFVENPLFPFGSFTAMYPNTNQLKAGGLIWTGVTSNSDLSASGGAIGSSCNDWSNQGYQPVLTSGSRTYTSNNTFYSEVGTCFPNTAHQYILCILPVTQGHIVT